MASAFTARRTGDTRLRACQSIYGPVLAFSPIASLRAHRQTFAEPDLPSKRRYIRTRYTEAYPHSTAAAQKERLKQQATNNDGTSGRAASDDNESGGRCETQASNAR